MKISPQNADHQDHRPERRGSLVRAVAHEERAAVHVVEVVWRDAPSTKADGALVETADEPRVGTRSQDPFAGGNPGVRSAHVAEGHARGGGHLVVAALAVAQLHGDHLLAL